MASALSNIDTIRLSANQLLDPEEKKRLGQFMTPSSVAEFMAGLFTFDSPRPVRLLDAGAGVGSLTAAFLDRAIASPHVKRIQATAYEVDEVMCRHLKPVLAEYRRAAIKAGTELETEVLAEDFVAACCAPLLGRRLRFTHAILNPPYKKIASDSQHRALLRSCGIETVNLYSAFVALAIDLMDPGGEIVAIVPRSFCNGPYYRPFRDWLLDRTAILQIHVFGSRDRAFKDDNVLQESVIFHLQRSGRQGSVRVSKSTDQTFHDYSCRPTAFSRIVKPGDPERFIHIPEDRKIAALGKRGTARLSLTEIGVEVSTGPVVDFRLAGHLRAEPSVDTAPLLYPAHFAGGFEWPRTMKKPNAIVVNSETERWLYPTGSYVVVRRFSSKEERRRIVASVFRPELAPGKLVGFENHLNVFHFKREGLPESLAYGIATFLNSTVVDEFFRTFSGHTQVNATDLRSLPYPSAESLTSLGEWARKHPSPSQHDIDRRVLLLA